MENKIEKCSYKEHKEVNAISYCQECNIYMCNKCSNLHQQLFYNHHTNNLDKNINEIFINICKENNHQIKLQYYCKDHNILCCSACIAKIEGEGNGQHKDCNVCFIKNIKNEKKNNLNKNIKYLEDLSNKLDDSIKELKIIFEKISKNKEELKLKIQKIFTNIRNILNEREDEILLEVDNKYNDIFCNEEIIKESEKLPNKIKLSLEKGKLINNEWNDNNKLNSIINDCINIENNIKNINLINLNINKIKLNNNIKFKFTPENEDLDKFIQNIKKFGNINNNIINLDIDSLILKNKNDINIFYKLISSQIEINNIKLLYRSTKEGLKYQNIINKINNKSNLIFLFFTGNKRIFGLFINSRLENIQKDQFYKDENAFVFSLDNNKIYKILIPEKALRFYDDENPIIIGNTRDCNGFFLQNDNINDSGLLNKPKIYDFQKTDELTEKLYKLTELEIFEINNK